VPAIELARSTETIKLLIKAGTDRFAVSVTAAGENQPGCRLLNGYFCHTPH
jgi:hypothetical protein